MIHAGKGSSCSVKPRTGSSQCSKLPLKASRKPATVLNKARMDIGMIIDLGDSCGCASSFQRALPRNVITKIRVM